MNKFIAIIITFALAACMAAFMAFSVCGHEVGYGHVHCGPDLSDLDMILIH